MIVFLAVAALLVAAIALFMNRPEFGRAPRGERLERIRRSPNYRDGAFRNRHATPQLTSGKGWWATMYDFLFERQERNRPDHALPAVKTDLKALDPKENLLVWFGHSSYLIQADGLRILVDPVFETASPLPFFNRPFEGTDLYKPEDMPGIDLLVITHDHWDHLDYGTVTKLRDRTGRVVCPLGVGEYFEYWSFDPQRITELDWGEQVALGGGFTVYCRPARHFSGRTFRANRTLWASFVVETPSQRIFLGGDGGDGLEGYATADQLKDSYFCACYAKGSSTAFEDAYKAEYGEAYPNGFAPLGYDAAMTVVYGIKAAEEQGLEAGSDEYKQAVIDAIAGGTIEGITGTFTFDEHHNPVKSTAILTYVDGKPELKEMF